MIDGGWFGQVPDGWGVLRLKRTVVLSKTRIDERPSELRYIGLENIESWTGRIIDSENSVVEDDEVVEGSGVVALFQPGEVLFGKLRPYLAKACLVTEPCVGTTELLALKPYPRLNARFLLYVFLTSGFVSSVDSSTFGTKMPRADWEFIGNVMIPLPPLREQLAIVNLLDSETHQIDTLITEKENLLTLLAEKRRSLVTRAVTHGLNTDATFCDSEIQWLGKIPNHWRIERSKWLFKERDERTVNNEGELLTVSHITGVTPRSEKDVNMFEAETTEGYKICRRGDLAINTMWAWMGAMGVSPVDGIVSPAYNVYTPDDALLGGYLDALVRTPQFATEVTRYSKGVWSSRLRLYPEEFFLVWLPVPPLEEQRAIVEHIETETKKLDALQAEAERTIGLLKERRAALIAAAVTGQFNVRVQV